MTIDNSSSLTIKSSNRQSWRSVGPVSRALNGGFVFSAVTSAIGVTAADGSIDLLSDGLTHLTALNGRWTATAQTGDLTLIATAALNDQAIGNSQLVTNSGSLLVNATGGTGGLLSIVAGTNHPLAVQSNQLFVSLVCSADSLFSADGQLTLMAANGNMTLDNTNSQQQAMTIQAGGSLIARTAASAGAGLSAVIVSGQHSRLTAGTDIQVEATDSLTVGSLGH
jgi:hypothetical protein